MKNEWYLRTQDETFGPETKERLIEWARMGRIQPGQDISSDGETWRPATEIPFLDMRWSIDIGDGNPRGPFNKHAAQALLASGRLPKGSKLVEVAPAYEEAAAAEVQEQGGKAPQDARDGVARQDGQGKQDGQGRELQDAREQNVRLEAKIRQVREEAKALRAELADAKKLLAAKDSVLAERNSELAERTAELEAKDSELAAKDSAIAAKETALAAKETALAEKDSEIVKAQEAVSAARASEAEYENRIQLLSEEIKRLPPTARLAADAQAAVYALMREEADELSAELEAEHKEIEALRQYRQKRTERLLARRQEILKHIGTDAEDMTRRALLAHPDDPRTAQLRQELDALRILQEKVARESEEKIRDLSTRLRERDTEVKRLQQQTGDITAIYRQLQETRERLQRREKELMEERQKSEEERQQHAAAQQALLTRLSALEMGLPGATNQSREARSVRLAPWMGLKQ